MDPHHPPPLSTLEEWEHPGEPDLPPSDRPGGRRVAQYLTGLLHGGAAWGDPLTPHDRALCRAWRFMTSGPLGRPQLYHIYQGSGVPWITPLHLPHNTCPVFVAVTVCSG